MTRPWAVTPRSWSSMTTGSPTRTSRTSATDSDESIASREFVTFMTRPATVLPRLAFTASTRTGRLAKNRTSFAGTWTPIRCASRATSPSVRRSSRADEATIARRVDRVDAPRQEPRLELVEPDLAPGGHERRLRAGELRLGDAHVADELGAVVVRPRDIGAGADAHGVGGRDGRREVRLRLRHGLRREPRGGVGRQAIVQGGVGWQREAVRLGLTGVLLRGGERVLLRDDVGVRLGDVPLAVGARDGLPGRRVRGGGLRGGEPGLRRRHAQRRGAHRLARGVRVDPGLRDVGGPRGALRLLDVVDGLQPRVAGLGGGRLGSVELVELRVGRAERVPALAEVEARDGRGGRRVVAAVDRAWGGPEAPKRALELEHVLPPIARSEVPVHRDRAGQDEHRAAVDGHRDRPGAELGPRARRAGDDVARRPALLELRVREHDGLRGAEADGPADDDLRRERATDDGDRDRRGLRRRGVGGDLRGRADLARADPPAERDDDEQAEGHGGQAGGAGGHRAVSPPATVAALGAPRRSRLLGMPRASRPAAAGRLLGDPPTSQFSSNRNPPRGARHSDPWSTPAALI